MKKILKFLTGRLFISILLILLQLATLFAVVVVAKGRWYWSLLFELVSVVMALVIVTRDENPAYKVAWMVVIMFLPVYGALFYLLFGNKREGRYAQRKLNQLVAKYSDKIPVLPGPDMVVREALENFDPMLARQSDYISNISSFPVWRNTEVEYFSLGEYFFERLLVELRKAKRFIFMEYFIIGEGEMWDAVLAVLLQKQREGVEIRFMYDDLGSIHTIPAHFDRKLRSLGFKVAMFNPMKPHLNPRFNYRDHRKICVIDGNVGFTGGLNLADEYINRTIRHGHWKDTAVMLRGDAVWNLSQMFLYLWMFSANEYLDMLRFLPTVQCRTDGFVQPFGDSPLDDQNVAENAYIQIINCARRYVWITTPYLILDNEMITALRIAAQSGIDVRIITPFYADKVYVHPVTRSYYKVLLEAGVRIFEYTPGFIHAKMFVCDDVVSIVGTTNMDYRSFYLHFECGVAFYGSSVVHQVRDDISRTLDVSREVTMGDVRSTRLLSRLARSLLRLFAPLM
ncbi:MAG: cardiolipin synthase [Sphaerochaetaceae bacterium]|jgi:cardiolipin synthase